MNKSTWFRVILSACAVVVNLAAHEATIKACEQLAHGQGWTNDEQQIWYDICRSRCSSAEQRSNPLKLGLCPEVKPQPLADDAPTLGAKVLESMVLLRCFRDRIGPRGIQIEGVKIKGDLSFEDAHIPWPIVIRNSHFEGVQMQGISADRGLDLSGSALTSLNLNGAHIGENLVLDDLQERPTMTLQRLVVLGRLSLVNSKLSTLDLSAATINRSHARVFPYSKDERGVSGLTDAWSGLFSLSQFHAQYKPRDPYSGLLLSGTTFEKQFSLANARIHGRIELPCAPSTNSYDVDIDGLRYDSIFAASKECATQEQEKNVTSTQLAFRWLQSTLNIVRSTIVPGASPDLPVIKWIESDKNFSFQPYSQYSSVLRADGNQVLADKVLVRGKTGVLLSSRARGKEKPWEAKSWLVSSFEFTTAYGIGTQSLRLIVLPLILASIGAVFSWMFRRIPLVVISVTILWFKGQNKLWGGILSHTIKDVTTAQEKLSKIGNRDYSKLKVSDCIEHWKSETIDDKEPNILKSWKMMRIVTRWKIHNTGVDLFTFWLPKLLPSKFRPEHIQEIIDSRKSLRLKPALLEWYLVFCWIASLVVLLIVVKEFARIL